MAKELLKINDPFGDFDLILVLGILGKQNC